MERCIDLHIHTTASDGTDTPTQAVERAKALGLAAIAITDHDSVAGVQEALEAGQRLGVQVIPGIEISADYRGSKAHIVGLFIDPASPALRPALDWAVNERADRNKKIVAAMAADGLDISLEALEKAYPDSLLGRPHMAEYLMKKGYVTTVKEAFDKYLGEGCPYYRDKERMPMAQAVQVIGQAGGIAVVAHPLQYGYEGQALEDFLQTAKALGCAALEAYYAEHSPAQQAFLLQKAQTLGLGVSGGSDYHGSRKPHIQMGSGIENSLSIPYAVLEALGTRKS
jgi:hypothetical protein